MDAYPSVDERQTRFHCPSTGAVVGITQCGKSTWITRFLQYWPKLVRGDGDADAPWPVKLVYCKSGHDEEFERDVTSCVPPSTEMVFYDEWPGARLCEQGFWPRQQGMSVCIIDDLAVHSADDEA